MKIKLAVIDNDKLYLHRLANSINNKYSEKIVIYTFDSLDSAAGVLNETKFDLMLLSAEFDHARFSDACSVAYFVASNEIESYKDCPAICKFQSIEMIYKQILDVFSETNSDIIAIKNKNGESGSRVIICQSIAGGDGGSTVAAALAINIARKGRKVLYLNYEKIMSTDVFFSAQGASSFNDVIYAVKSKKNNLNIKLEASVKSDQNGVFFYSGCKTALDMSELTEDEKIYLLKVLKNCGRYDDIIVDMNFEFNKFSEEMYEIASKILVVCNGRKMSVYKCNSAIKSFALIDGQNGCGITDKLLLLYNMFVNGVSDTVSYANITVAGGVPQYDHMSPYDIAVRISQMKFFDNEYFTV